MGSALYEPSVLNGETAELKTTITALKKNGTKDVFLFADVEDNPLNFRPRVSILAEILRAGRAEH